MMVGVSEQILVLNTYMGVYIHDADVLRFKQLYGMRMIQYKCYKFSSSLPVYRWQVFNSYIGITPAAVVPEPEVLRRERNPGHLQETFRGLLGLGSSSRSSSLSPCSSETLTSVWASGSVVWPCGSQAIIMHQRIAATIRTVTAPTNVSSQALV